MFVYVVVENGSAYFAVYTTYELAVNAVKDKYKHEDNSCNELDILENDTGIMELYIEKQIYITITKVPVI